jgi:class 3 adenylate cyclase
VRDPTPLTKPIIEHFFAAVLFADISGFTPLAEELAKQGAVGAERLKEVLDICFGKLVELAAEFGGDVIKFPGDGVLVLWHARQEAGEDLVQAVRLASKCALRIQENLDGLEAIKGHAANQPEAIRLRLRVAIGAGPAFAASVGGSEDRWEFVVGGEALGQIAAAVRRASPGEVVCSPEARTLVETRAAKAAGEGGRTLQKLEPAVPPPVVELPRLPAEASAALRQYIPRLIQARVDAGQAGWLAEFRHVTVLFVNVPRAELAPGGSPDLLQTIASTLQKAAHRFGGGVNEVVVDDKGLTLVAGWGQSLATHENNAARACQAALQAQGELLEAGVECGMGLATGTAFVATRGGPRRAEYAIIGDVVNLAARLMGAATGTVLCDAATRADSRRRMTFESLPPVRLKGKAEPVSVFRPLSAKVRSQPGRQPLFGRYEEQRHLVARLDALAQRREGGVVVIMGEAGIGKSRVIADLLERTQASRVRGAVGAGEDLERSSAYYAWRSIFSSLLALDRPDWETQRSRVLELLDLDEHHRDLAPLLNGVLLLGLPENQTTSRLTTEARAERTRDLLIELLQQALHNSPTLIVLEDAHWLDSASWELAEAVHRAIPGLLLVIATRPLSTEQMPAELRRLLEEEATLKLGLKSLTPEEALALVCHRLDVDSLPESVARLLQEKAEGHPFFIEQLASALRDQGIIRVTDGECFLAADPSCLQSTLLPQTVQAAIRVRIDRLTQQQQLTLKVSSVLGRVFRPGEVAEIHPVTSDAADLRQQLDAMMELDLLQQAAGDGESAYSFRHTITQEVTYGLLPFAQRRQLHRAAGEWLERHHAADLARIYPLLAHHWSETEDTLKALDYLEKAGEAAMAAFANREATSFFRQALALAGSKGLDLPKKELTFRRAHWHRRIGEALFYTGDSQGCLNESSRCLDILGFPLVPSRSSKAGRLVMHTAAQAVHLVFPERFVEPDPHRRACFAEAAEAASQCAWTMYGRRDTLALIVASLAAVNWAQKAKRQSVMSLGIAGATLGALRLKGLADRYFALARANALESKQFQQLAWVVAMESQDLMASGKLAACEKMLMDFFPLVQSSGDREAISLMYSGLSIVAYLFGRCDQMRERCLAALEAVGNEPYRSAPYNHFLVAQSAFLVSGPHEARPVIEERRRKATEATVPDEWVPIFFSYLEAALFTGLKDWAAAKAAIKQAMAYGMLVASPPSWSPTLLLDACTGLWEQLAAANDAQTREIARLTERALRWFRFHVWVHPVHQATYLLAHGQAAWLKGSHDKAMKLWRRGVEAAERLSRSFESGRCHYEIGRRSPAGSPDGRIHLQAARLIFAQCKTTYYLDQVDALLADRNPGNM